MKIRTLWFVAFLVLIGGCAEKERAAPTTEEAATTAAEAIPATAAEAMAEGGAAEMGTEAFIKHMHVHAEQLGKINAALSFGKLEAARTPAYWLSRHEGVTGPLYDWETYLDQMRNAASEVAEASDLATARAAAGRIVEGCQGCHAANGVEVLITGPAAK